MKKISILRRLYKAYLLLLNLFFLATYLPAEAREELTYSCVRCDLPHFLSPINYVEITLCESAALPLSRRV